MSIFKKKSPQETPEVISKLSELLEGKESSLNIDPTQFNPQKLTFFEKCVSFYLKFLIIFFIIFGIFCIGVIFSFGFNCGLEILYPDKQQLAMPIILHKLKLLSITTFQLFLLISVFISFNAILYYIVFYFVNKKRKKEVENLKEKNASLEKVIKDKLTRDNLNDNLNKKGDN